MLRNELTAVKEMIDQYNRTIDEENERVFSIKAKLLSGLREVSAKARDAWALAIYSNASEDALGRYFSHHMRILAECLALLTSNRKPVFQNSFDAEQDDVGEPVRQEVVELLDHLYRFFGNFIDVGMNIPVFLQEKIIHHQHAACDEVLALLEDCVTENELKRPLVIYLQHMDSLDDKTILTFKELNYFQKVLTVLHGTLKPQAQNDSDRRVEEKLIEINFNQLEIFAYTQRRIRTHLKGKTVPVRLAGYKAHLLEVSFLTKAGSDAYDTLRPSLQFMLESWLKSEILALEHSLEKIIDEAVLPSAAKLRLTLSMPRLACLIKLFYKSKLAEEIPLKQIFQFVAAHFSTRQQLCISAESLSKEYYALDMYTAAKVRGLLKNMIAMIDEGFSWQL